MNIFNFVFALAIILSTSNSSAASLQPGNLQNTASALALKKVVPEVQYQGKRYRIRYTRDKEINLEYEGRKTLLQRIPKRFDPSLVGAEVFIGFLPEELQLYKDSGDLLYVSTIRTSGGNGGGQCGSGAEIFLNVLDMNVKRPRIRASILIGSCDESIELLDQDMSEELLGRIGVEKGRLVFQFMNYGSFPGYPIAMMSDDLKSLHFR